jgi:hypothetical protein
MFQASTEAVAVCTAVPFAKPDIWAIEAICKMYSSSARSLQSSDSSQIRKASDIWKMQKIAVSVYPTLNP